MLNTIEIRTLGGLEISIDGEPLRLTGRTPRRPLELLKALVAAGLRGLAVERLTDVLWPDSEGDSAYRALVTNVYRLRRMLRNHCAVVFTGSQLRLDPAHVCVDAWQFEREVSDLDDATRAQRTIAAYDGAFLGDDCAPFAIETRERLRRKFIRAVLVLADALDRCSQPTAAIELLEGALDIEPDSAQLREALQHAFTSGPRSAAAVDAQRRLHARARLAA